MGIVSLFLTVGTNSPQPQAVMCGFETEVVRHLVLKLLNVRRKEFNDAPALGADHVIVVFVIIVVLVICLVVPESDLAGEAGFAVLFPDTHGRELEDITGEDSTSVSVDAPVPGLAGEVA